VAVKRFRPHFGVVAEKQDRTETMSESEEDNAMQGGRNMKVTRFALATVLWLGLVATTRAATYCVATNGDDGNDGSDWAHPMKTINAAVLNYAGPGDTVLVSNGVYVLSATIGLTGKGNLHLRSWNHGALDPTNTIIDGNATVLGLLAWNGSPTIEGFTVSNCSNSFGGGAISLWGGGAQVLGCRLINNVASDAAGDTQGGGLFLNGAGSLASNCTIRGNSAAIGGGVYLVNGAAITHSIVENNTATNGSGGGIYSETRAQTVGNCVMAGNKAYASGGGVYNATLNNCVLSNNAAGTYGGGSYNYGGGAFRATMYNCLIIGNKADQGGGVFSAFVTPGSELYNCTIVGNTADVAGGVDMNSLGAVNNCIVYFNVSGGGPGDVTNLRGTGGVTNTCTTPLITGPGNIEDDPRFVSVAGGNYRLTGHSRCVNAGTNGSWTTSYPCDLDGGPRIRDSRVDMGAYEYIPSGTVFMIQ
jgi:predicted outer membrane repeat protein